MFTVVVLWGLAVAWVIANGVFVQKPVWLYRRRRALLAWVLFGGCVGALAGLLGHGGQRFSLPASVLGAVVAGWVVCRFTRWGAAAQPQPSQPVEPLAKQPAS